MSNLFNPYALTALGKPLQQRQSPELRVETPHISRAQLDMAQHAFVRFLDQARLSRVPNPTQQGRLADGTPYRIVTASGAPIMQVWPVGEDVEKRPVELPHGILLLYEGESPEFVVVQFSPDSDGGSPRWRSTKVKKGRCGATMLPTNVKRNGVPVFALTNHGMYDGEIQTETKFGPGGAISEPHPSSSGTFIVNGGVMECALAATALILDSRQMVFARMTKAGKVAFNTLAVPEISREDEDHLIQEPKEPEAIVDLLSGIDDRVYAPMFALPNQRSVVVRFRNPWPSGTPAEETTNFCYELLRIADDVIPAHRLYPIPSRYDQEVWLNVHHDDDGIVVDKSINDISQPARVVNVSVLCEVADTIDYFMVPWEGTTDKSKENLYHEGGYCAGKLFEDWSAFTASMPIRGVTQGGRHEIDLKDITISASSDEDILLNSYADFFGAVKELRINSKIRGKGISKRRYERVDRDPEYKIGDPGNRFAGTSPADIILNEWGVSSRVPWAERYIQTTSSEIEYEAILNVGGKEIDLAKIKGTSSYVADLHKENYGSRNDYSKPSTIHVELSASVLCVLGFDKLSETIFGVRVIAESGGEKEIKVPYSATSNDRTAFSIHMAFKEYFVVYTKGALVFEHHLEDSVKLMQFSAFAKIWDGHIPEDKIVRDEFSNDVYAQYYYTWWGAEREDISDGGCTKYKYTPKENTEQWGGGRFIRDIHHAEIDPSKNEFSILSMASGSNGDIAGQFASASQATDYLPSKTMVAVDPISGSCAVVNDVCKILIDPEGNVTPIRDVTGLPDESLKRWCTST